MKKAIFILPYFGKLPNYFQLYLQSCKYNKDFDWLILTDDLTPYEYPDNVIVVMKTFEDVKILIQSKFDFEISLKNPYKLCDYKPTFGYVFQDYIADYDFWGYVDCDCIWGDLNKYITWDLLNKYDKLFLLGHLTIYRNTMENNTMFMRSLNNIERYKEVFSSGKSELFDEAINNKSINDIYSYYNIPVYENKNRADVSPKFLTVRLTDYEGPNEIEIIEPCKFQFFEWNKGKLYNISYSCFYTKKNIKEHIYLHLHGERKMKYKEDISWDHFYIFRNRFVNCEKQLIFIMCLDYIITLFKDFVMNIYKKSPVINLFKSKIKKMIRR